MLRLAHNLNRHTPMKLQYLCMAALSVLLLFAAGLPSSAQSDEPRESTTMYVKVASSNADAVVMSSTDFFEQEPLGRLIQNQPVQMLEKTDAEYVKIIATVGEKRVEGWVKKIILQGKPLENSPRVTESEDIDNASFSDGHRLDIEDEMRMDSQRMKEALDRIDDFEAVVAKRFSLEGELPDPTMVKANLRQFGIDGGLAPGSSK